MVRKLYSTFIILILLVYLSGCSLVNKESKYTFSDFMCNMTEGHLEVKYNGGVNRKLLYEYDKDLLMYCDFHTENDCYYIYWTYPGESGFFMGLIDIPKDTEIHNKNKTIYDLSTGDLIGYGYVQEIRMDLKQYKGQESDIDVLNYILDGNDYWSYIKENDFYCEKHDRYYSKRLDKCPYCEAEMYN